MTLYIPYIYDIALALILLISVANGYKKGILRTVLGIVCTAAAIIAASLLSSYEASSWVYDRYFHEKVLERIDASVQDAKKETADNMRNRAQSAADEYIDRHLGGSDTAKELIRDALDNTDEETVKDAAGQLYGFVGVDIDTLLTNEEISGKIKDAASEYSGIAAEKINKRLPSGIRISEDEVEQVMGDTDAVESLVYEVLGIKSEKKDTMTLSGYIEERYVRPMAVRIISAALWFLTFSLVNMILRLIVGVILSVRKIELVKACDSALGGLLGALGGAAVAAALTVLAVIIVRFTGGTDFMNEEIFSQTFVFGKIYFFAKEFC